MKDVTVEQERTAQRELEQTIYEATLSAFATFTSKTGLTPSRLSIELFEVTTFGSPATLYAVGEVNAEVSWSRRR